MPYLLRASVTSTDAQVEFRRAPRSDTPKHVRAKRPRPSCHGCGRLQAVLYAPDRAVALPAVQRLAVKEGDEPRPHPRTGPCARDVRMSRTTGAWFGRSRQVAGRELNRIQVELQ